jgi:hypothetical protein
MGIMYFEPRTKGPINLSTTTPTGHHILEALVKLGLARGCEECTKLRGSTN